ncbi:MAG: DUF3553 domain-containing protein [Acidobacteria bacterium]|nr:DUF3553 domain-containing protein [Acidobacteriota bacterium]
MDQGQFIRHRARPEWGIGQILRRADDRIDVQFQHALVTLRLSIAAAFIESVSKSEAVAAGVAVKAVRKTAARKTPAKKRAVEPEEPEEAEADDEADD